MNNKPKLIPNSSMPDNIHCFDVKTFTYEHSIIYDT